MGMTKVVIRFFRATGSSRTVTVTPLTRRLLWILPLVGFLVSWGAVERHHGLSLACMESTRNGLVFVSAFEQLLHHTRPPLKSKIPPSTAHTVLNPQRREASTTTAPQTSLFFTPNENNLQTRSTKRNHDHKSLTFHSSSKDARCVPLFGKGDSDDSDNDEKIDDISNKSDGKANKKKERSSPMRRIGGRIRREKSPSSSSPSPSSSSSSSSSSSTLSTIFDSIKKRLPSGGVLVVGLLVLTLLKNLLFGGVGDDPGYSYYSYSSSSSVEYQTVINPDGSRSVIETDRKENSNLKTNIPGLSGKEFIDSRGGRGDVLTDYFYIEE